MTDDLFQQATEDYLRAKARKEQTVAAVLRANAEDHEADVELARMQNVLDWIEPRRPQVQNEPQEPAEAAPPPRPPRPRAASRRPRAKKKSLSELVENAVRQIGGSVKNTEILEHLHREGHDFTALQVRGSAKHLAQKGKLVSGGYGIWMLPEDAPQPEDDPQLDFAPAVPAAEAVMASVNGHVPAGTY